MKILLAIAVLLMPMSVLALEDCECEPVAYQELMNMSAAEVATKMEIYARYKDAHSTAGSTYCYYRCVSEYEHLRIIKQDKEIERSKERLGRQATEPGKMLTGSGPRRSGLR